MLDRHPSPAAANRRQRSDRARPLIAFLDYPDVFEDFYPHCGVDQRSFATRWADTGNHAFVSLLQSHVGDVVWYEHSISPEVDEARHEATGCRVKVLPSSWLHRRAWRAFYLPRAAWRWRRAYPWFAVAASYLGPMSWRFLQALRRDQPDFFFVQDYASGRYDMLRWISRCMGVPLIAYHSGSRPEAYVGRWAKRWTIPSADKLIASSRAELEMLAGRFQVPRERLELILTPIDTAVYRPLDRNAACHAAGLDPSRRYLLFMGRLDDRVKRVGALIQAFGKQAGQHRDTDLVIAGDGQDREQLQRLASSAAPERVHFLGWISNAAMKVQLYNAAECLWLPSIKEGFPTVVGESLACGTPVIGSDVGGVAEVVAPQETGWLLRPGDDDAIAERMAHILSHPGDLQAMRPRARQAAEGRVSRESVGAALRTCFESVRQRRD